MFVDFFIAYGRVIQAVSGIHKNTTRQVLAFLFSVFLFVGINGAALAQGTEQPVRIGKKITIASEVFKGKRDIYVALPNGYFVSGKDYPVVYLLDGEGLFNISQGIISTLAEAHEMGEVILVGVAHKNRWQELAGKDRETLSGFLKAEVFPYIDQHYRTLSHRTMIGHSLGGSFLWSSLANSWLKPDAMITISPVIRKEGPALYPKLAKALQDPEDRPKYIYISMGSEGGQFASTHAKLSSILEKQTEVRWHGDKFPLDSHGAVPTPSMHYAMQDFYAGWVMPQISNLSILSSSRALQDIGGYQAIKKYYSTYAQRLGYATGVPDIVWSRVAWTLVNEGKFEKLSEFVRDEGMGHGNVLQYIIPVLISKKELQSAILVAKLNAKFHSDMSIAWTLLGKAYEAAEQPKTAKAAYAKADQLVAP